MLNGTRTEKRPTQGQAIKALAEMRRELQGAILVQGILIDRAGGSVSITQQEMLDATGWKLRNGFTTGEDRPGDGTWLFTVEKPDVPVNADDEAEAKRIREMTAEEFDAYVRQREAKEGQQPPAANAALEGDDTGDSDPA